ncbi:MAG TPA: septal ring lytic transglycosylase RlpA family protein [Xanthobacteraceae bacterium]|nr:septal ring lytic transglycosylase RlpA family protein [Xanthobacteraceae bacterium]
MKRIVLALCLAALAGAAQAEARDHRHPKAADSPGRAESALRWFAAHAAAPTASPAASPASVRTAKPHVVAVAVAPSDTQAATPPTRSLFAPAATARETPRLGHGRVSSCSEGQRIISAYYMDGRRTASGERFDPGGMTAAHRSLPFGTHLKVINPRNGKVVVVRINDRGPFVKGVTLDLSRGAAQAIGLSGTGAVCMAQM